MVIVTLDQNDSTFNWSPRTWWCDSCSCWTIFSKYLDSYIVLKGNGPQYVDRGRSPYSWGVLKCTLNRIIFLDMTIRRREFSRPCNCRMWPGMWELDINVIKHISDPCLVSHSFFFPLIMATANVLELCWWFSGIFYIYTYIRIYVYLQKYERCIVQLNIKLKDEKCNNTEIELLCWVWSSGVFVNIDIIQWILA